MCEKVVGRSRDFFFFFLLPLNTCVNTSLNVMCIHERLDIEPWVLHTRPVPLQESGEVATQLKRMISTFPPSTVQQKSHLVSTYFYE